MTKKAEHLLQAVRGFAAVGTREHVFREGKAIEGRIAFDVAEESNAIGVFVHDDPRPALPASASRTARRQR